MVCSSVELPLSRVLLMSLIMISALACRVRGVEGVDDMELSDVRTGAELASPDEGRVRRIVSSVSGLRRGVGTLLGIGIVSGRAGGSARLESIDGINLVFADVCLPKLLRAYRVGVLGLG